MDWSKVILLLRIKDKETREELRQKALKENLTRMELQSLIDLYNLKNRQKSYLQKEEFTVERGSLYQYKRAHPKGPETGTSITVDCGFNVLRNIAIVNSEQANTDTLWINIDGGFETIIRQKIYFRGVNTPEIYFNEGRKAKDFVKRQLSQCPFVIIKTYKTDKCDRYIADLFFLKEEKNPDKVSSEGILLNSEIVTKGYGRKI